MVDDVTVIYKTKIIKVLATHHQSTTIASNGWTEIKYRHTRKYSHQDWQATAQLILKEDAGQSLSPRSGADL